MISPRSVWAVAMAAFCLPVSALTLTSEYRIVIPDDCRTGVQRALRAGAEALKADLKEGSGLDLPILTASEAGKGRSIYIGHEFAERAGLMPKGKNALEGWENVVAEKGGDIYLFGADRPGRRSSRPLGWTECVLPSLKALTNFMETELGIAFLYPGQSGRDVPQIGKVAVKDGLFRRRKPKIVFDTGRVYEMMHSVANNVFGSGGFKSYGGHTYPYAVPVAKYGRKHPEYFALYGGKRLSNHAFSVLCLSNPQVEELLVKELADRFDEGYDFVELGQNDGGMYCQCEKCRRKFGTDDPGEMLWLFHTHIARRLYKSHPGKTVVILSYAKNYNPPKTFRTFPANVMVELCNYEERSFRAWKGYVVPKGFAVYTYAWGVYQLAGYTPLGSFIYVGEAARRLHDNGVRGIYRCGYGEKFGLEGPSYAVFSRLLENPALDPRAVSGDFSMRAFGPAGEKMKKFFAVLDARLKMYDKLREGFGSDEKGVIVSSTEPEDPSDLFACLYPSGVLNNLELLLSDAEKTFGLSEKHRRRLSLVRLEFDHVAKIARTVHLYNAYQLTPQKGLFDALIGELRARSKFVHGLFDEKGGVRGIPGWPELRVLPGAKPDILMSNGCLKALLGAPFKWDVDTVRPVSPGDVDERAAGNLVSDDPKAWDEGEKFTDRETFLTPPHSFRLDAGKDGSRVLFYIFDNRPGKMRLKPNTRYRLSYCTKVDGLLPRRRGGGAEFNVNVDPRNKQAGRFVYPDVLSPCAVPGWFRHEHEFRTYDSVPAARPYAVLALRLRFVDGSAWYDGIRVDEIGPASR